MNKLHHYFGIGLFVLCVGGGFVLGVNASENDHSKGKSSKDVAPVQNKQYIADCGSCHFAYQPGLLPERSWKKLLLGLGDHFGENAEVDPATLPPLLEYLTSQAGDRVDYGRSRKIMASINPTDTPLRITQTRYFVNKHQEIPPGVWEKNPKVGSLIRCETCHTKAQQGSFNEHEVQIPDVGRWEKD